VTAQSPQGGHEHNSQTGQTGRSNIPIPDPSVLTTESLNREVNHLRELIEVQIAQLADQLERYSDRHQERHREVVDRAVDHLRELCQVKFDQVNLQFEERDKRFEETRDASVATVEAALAAAKEAVGKSEAATTKDLDGIKTLISETAKRFEDQIRDLKERIDRDVGRASGLGQAWGYGIAAITVLVSVISVVVIIATR
jgi:Fe2+ transport system protein B